MKGKEAALTARRRAADAERENAALRRELAEQKFHAEQQMAALKDELRAARADHLREAERLAGEELARKMKKLEEERRSRGLSDDIVLHLLYRNDRFIFNACRYVSMTTGVPPIDALAMVLTWRTDKDVVVLPRGERLVEMGVAEDGWVSRQLKNLGPGWRKTSHYKNLAMSLDRAEAEGHPRIHPEYKPKWYAGEWYWHGIELVGSDA